LPGTTALNAALPRATSAEASIPIEQAMVSNRLLRCMHPQDFARLQPHFTRVPIAVEASLASVGEPIDTICFPEGAVIGFLDVLEDGRRLAVGLVGLEGFVGWPVLMGSDRSPYDVVVRAENSTAVKIDARPLLDAVDASPRLRELMLRFASTFMVQMGRTIVSNLIHPIERRTARWLLLYHDRVQGDEITLTHEELSIMLGVRRASVTEALHHLEGAHAIRSLRGRVVVSNRAQLEEVAGESYGYAEAEYRRLIPTVI
jgi:CRP-like cAMP-binding protein